jgi:hypothetical protein
MEQYIPKPALVAKIERRRNAALIRQKNLEFIGQETVLNEMVANELNRILSFINTLEVKEVDLEKEIQMFSMDLAMKENNGDWEKDIAVTAKYFFELGLKAQKGEEI